MKISISNDVLSLQQILGRPLLSQTNAAYSKEFVFDANGLTVGDVKRLSLEVQRKFGSRCVGAYPSQDKFVVILKTDLRPVTV